MLPALLLPLVQAASATPVRRTLPSSYLNPQFGQSQANILQYTGDSLQYLASGVNAQGEFASPRGAFAGWVGANGWTVTAGWDLAAGQTRFETLFRDSMNVLSTTSSDGQTWTTPFADDYNDDDGWWALALITGYKAYGDQQYLDWAEQLFNVSGTWGGATGPDAPQFTLSHGYVHQADIDAGKFTTDKWLTAQIPQTCNGQSLIDGVCTSQISQLRGDADRC